MKSNVTSRMTSALLLLFPLMLLTGCGTQQKAQVEYRTLKQPRLNLPAELTVPIDSPQPLALMTFGDSISLNAKLYGIIERCNVDRAAIRLLDSH